jgi:hypothetical protein
LEIFRRLAIAAARDKIMQAKVAAPSIIGSLIVVGFLADVPLNDGARIFK